MLALLLAGYVAIICYLLDTSGWREVMWEYRSNFPQFKKENAVNHAEKNFELQCCLLWIHTCSLWAWLFFLWLAGMVWSFMSKETVLLLNPILSAWLNVNWNPKRHFTWHPQIKATGMKLLIVFIQACSDAKARPGFLSDKSLDPAIKAIVKKFPVTDTKVCSLNVLEML